MLFRNRINALRAGIVSGAVALATQAHAAVPADVTTAIGDMKTDGTTVATAVLVAVIVVGAIKFLRRSM